MNVLIAGEVNPDLILQECGIFPEAGKEVRVQDMNLTLGGSSAICAAGLTRLGDRVTLAAAVGEDLYGDYCLDLLRRAGVDVSQVRRRTDLKTGITVAITSARDRALVTYPGTIAALRADDLPDSMFAGHHHFHVSAWFLQDALRSGLKERFAAARRAGLTTSLDPGYDPSEEWSQELLDALTEVDVFLPNEVEIRGITGCRNVEEGVRKLDNGHLLIVAKLGAEGCLVWDRGKTLRVPAFPVDVMDTTGAGDSFNAGFLHTWIRRNEISECLRFAAACGSMSTRGLGGTAMQPYEDEVRGFLKEQESGELAETGKPG
jgi:sugar/nucleoside kinase (ribokinase family)